METRKQVVAGRSCFGDYRDVYVVGDYDYGSCSRPRRPGASEAARAMPDHRREPGPRADPARRQALQVRYAVGLPTVIDKATELANAIDSLIERRIRQASDEEWRPHYMDTSPFQELVDLLREILKEP